MPSILSSHRAAVSCRSQGTQPCRRARGVRRGFTLVELLVVIGIIALLISILLPSLNRAREMAKQTVCLSNLKNMGNALTMYMGENNGYYPGHCHRNSRGIIYAIWPTRLRAYLGGDQNVFYCPSQDPSYQWAKTPGPGVTVSEPAGDEDSGYGYNNGEMLLDVFKVQFSYGYNDWGTNDPTAINEQQRGMGGDIAWVPGGTIHERNSSQIRDTSDMIVITDKTSTGMWNFNIDPRDTTQAPAQIHQKGSNVLYADGHAQWTEEQSLVLFDVRTKQYYSRGSRQWNLNAPQWNSDHQP